MWRFHHRGVMILLITLRSPLHWLKGFASHVALSLQRVHDSAYYISGSFCIVSVSLTLSTYFSSSPILSVSCFCAFYSI